MIAVIIPNHNGLSDLKDCVESLKGQTCKNFATILVDNNSSDDSVLFMRKFYPECKIMQLNYNSGFAKAVNLGIKFALEEQNVQYICLLNNDIECDSNFLDELVVGFKTPDIGSVSCKMLNFYERQLIDDAGNFVKLIGSPYPRGHGEIDKGQYDKGELIFGACAGAAMYKREVFEKVGFFDEDFFAYYEDVDFSFRMQFQGYKCYYSPKAICYHKRGATTKNKPLSRYYFCEKNLVALIIKNYPASVLFKYFLFFFVVRFLILVVHILKHHSIKIYFTSLKGHLEGLLNSPKSIKKRLIIQRNKKVDNDYILSLFTNS